MTENIRIAELQSDKLFEVQREFKKDGLFFSIVFRRIDNEDLFEGFTEQQGRVIIESALIAFADSEVKQMAKGYFLPIDPKAIITKRFIEIELLYCFSPHTATENSDSRADS
jgi:hypothetical protein